MHPLPHTRATSACGEKLPPPTCGGPDYTDAAIGFCGREREGEGEGERGRGAEKERERKCEERAIERERKIGRPDSTGAVISKRIHQCFV